MAPVSFHIKSDGEFLNSRMWVPEKSRDEAVVFCHGWGGGASYDDLLALLGDRGYFALRFEQRGYGESTGGADLSLWSRDMAACATALSGIARRVWSAGQSTGGSIALIAATTHECFCGAISIAPFCSLERILEDNSDARGTLEERFGILQEKHYRAADTLRFVPKLRKPVFLAHGTEDHRVPFVHGELISTQLGKNARFRPVPGANHHLTNIDRSPIFREILEWLEAH